MIKLDSYFVELAWRELRDSRWYKSRPAGLDDEEITMTLLGIENRSYGSIMGGDRNRPCLIIIASDKIIGESYEILIPLPE